MAIQLSVAARNARLDSIESVAGAAAHLKIYSGTAPADCATAATGTLLCDITLPSDWMNAAAAGQKTKLGTWAGTGTAGASTGTNAGYFRLTDAAGTTCHMQGSVTANGGGGDMTLDNISIAENQSVTVNTFTLNDANA